ncbi:Thiamine-phosphate synthase [Aphelenchoides besseyi]|nr:Thiamine-phosphate synthase [Aphelenchoides besseyi]
MRPEIDLRLYLIVDPDLCGGHSEAVKVVEKAITGGVTIVQLRAPNWHKKAILSLAQDLLAVTKQHRISFLIDDHVDVAIAAGADGVHVGQRDLPPSVVRKLMGEDAIIGWSVSSVEEVERTKDFDNMIDYLGVGPVFPTATKPDHNKPIGIEGLHRLCQLTSYPTVAIGGLNRTNAVDVMTTKVGGIAVISAICNSEDPQKTARELRSMVDSKPTTKRRLNLLTIAGSDSSGGAGVQADLKTFGALGCYGASVLTILTAQNTRGVQAIHVPDAAFVDSQLTSVFDDLNFDAVKIGALGNSEVVRIVAKHLRKQKPKWFVLDPVIVTTTGHKLLPDEGVEVIVSEMFPLATIITPNLNESAALLGEQLAVDEGSIITQGKQLLELGAMAVLMKGGHLDESEHSTDWLITRDETVRIDGKRIRKLENGKTIGSDGLHGSGCTLASAIACYLPIFNGDLQRAVRAAKNFVTNAIRLSSELDVGKGAPPLNHFYQTPRQP